MYRRLIVALVFAGVLVVIAAGAVLAQGSATKQVGLVIAFPDGKEHLEIVTVPVAATTLEVLQAAKITLVTQNTAYGPALCSINATGCPATNCFCDSAHFWAVYHLNAGARSWVQAMESIGTYAPPPGAVEGFAWSGFDASYNPTARPAVYTFDEIVAKTSPAPVGVPEPSTLLLLGTGVAGLAGYVRYGRARRVAH